MVLVDDIERQIKEFERKAEEDLKLARILESEAISLEQNEVWDKSSKKYHDAASQFFTACVYLESIDLWITGLKDDILKQLKLRKSDERYLNYNKRIKEYHKKSADLYRKASDIQGKLQNKFLQADLLGKAARQYYRVFELSDEEELKIHVEPGKVYSFSDTLAGIIMAMYSSAANLFNEIGIEFEESGKNSKAYIFYGYMGDAYLSIALIHEKDKYWPFETVSAQAENYLCAAEAYYKSGKLSKKVGVSSVVSYARMEWEYAQRGIFDFFKDDKGYTTLDDLKRAIMAYEKAKVLYDKLGMKTAEYCAQKVGEIQSTLEPISSQMPTQLRPKGTRVTGFPWADTEYSRVMSKVRQFILPNDLESYQIVMVSLLNYMGQNYMDNFFKGEEYTEESFHQDLSRHLKLDTSIGASALNEIYTGGGRVDILVRGVPLELKVEKAIADTIVVIDKHKSQASHYASSQGKQVGFLCILDLTEKKMPIPHPSNDIRVVQVPVHGYEEDKLLFPSIIIALVIRGNLPPPSGLS